MQNEYLVGLIVLCLAWSAVCEEMLESYCDETTPCAWVHYDPYTERIIDRERNYMCICKKGQQCDHVVEDVTKFAYYIYGCRKRDPNKMTALDR